MQLTYTWKEFLDISAVFGNQFGYAFLQCFDDHEFVSPLLTTSVQHTSAASRAVSFATPELRLPFQALLWEEKSIEGVYRGGQPVQNHSKFPFVNSLHDSILMTVNHPNLHSMTFCGAGHSKKFLSFFFRLQSFTNTHQQLQGFTQIFVVHLCNWIRWFQSMLPQNMYYFIVKSNIWKNEDIGNRTRLTSFSHLFFSNKLQSYFKNDVRFANNLSNWLLERVNDVLLKISS